MSVQQDLFFAIAPPTDVTVNGRYAVYSTTVAVTAANYDWATAMGANVPKGSVMLVLEASLQDCYVRFKPTTSTAATTFTNGLIIKANQPGRPFYVNPIQHGVLDIIGTGAGTLQVQAGSFTGLRNYQ